jgi:diguanylate cyclase (GGDEF)-like protein
MSSALFIPAPQVESDTRARADALHRAVENVLQQVLDLSSIVALELSSPLLLDGPVVVERRQRPRRAPEGTGSTLSIRVLPLPATQHVPEATLWVSSTTERGFQEASVLPVLLSALLDSEISRLVAENTARGALEIANRDPATGLGNRRAWMHTLQVEAGRTIRTGRPLAVLILDIDGLKAVNDVHGHAAGDELIARTASALITTRRVTDQVCRLGGDEFGITAPDTDAASASMLANRMRSCLEDRGVRVSLGWAVSQGVGDVEDLWQRADTAMYADKRARR